ncbi:proto-oncogene Mas-like [Hyperolius riggenbachi]|uniref:proto-oncogene Mas-like n=1 Tax=Hyperolius riggenbachi TaxID=752182 RepID=UPI0035A2C312
MDPENITAQLSTEDAMYWNNHTMLFKPVFNMIISPIIMIVSIIGLTGNSLVVWYLCFKIKRNTSTIYILNLAMADAGFLLSVFILTVLEMVFGLMPQNHFEDVHFIGTIHALHLSCIFGYTTSLCLLTAISIERCLSVLYPMWYHCKRPPHLSSVICTFIWITSCVISVLELAFCYNVTYNRKGLVEESSKECKVVFIIICCFSFVIFIPFMIVSSLILLIKVGARFQQRQYKKLYVVITVTVVVFLAFGMPMRILILAWYKHHIMPPFPMMDIFSVFCSLNSTINPFVYYLVGRQGSHGGEVTLLTILQAVFRDEGTSCKREQRKTIAENETAI